MDNYHEIVARGIAKRKEASWKVQREKRAEFEKKIKNATLENIEALEKEISDLECHHIHRGDKDREYKHYEGAEEHDEYAEMFEELGDVACNRKVELKA